MDHKPTPGPTPPEPTPTPEPDLVDSDLGFFRLIANPHRLKPIAPEPVITRSTFESDIERAILSEYRDVYVNAYLIDRIKRAIRDELRAYFIDTVVADIVSEITEQCIDDGSIHP